MEAAGVAIGLSVSALTLCALLWRYLCRPIYRAACGTRGFFENVRDGLVELRDLIREFTRYMQTTERRFEEVDRRLSVLERSRRDNAFPR